MLTLTPADQLSDPQTQSQAAMSDYSHPLIAPERLQELYKAWESVVVHGKDPNPGAVREEVKQSWKRCRELGLDPFSRMGPQVMKGADFKKLYQANELLVQAAASTLKIIEVSVRDTGYIITLADKAGYVLAVTGGHDILKQARVNHYLPGCLRSCDHAGTNAIGLCLDLGEPVQMVGPEHYRTSIHGWTCCSAPVLDADGTVLGALTMSGPSSESQPHTLPLIISAAQAIEGQLREKRLNNDKVRLNTMLYQIVDSMSEGVIALDESLRVTHCNSISAYMLDMDSSELQGRSILEFVPGDAPMAKALHNKSLFRSKEVWFSAVDKRFLCSVNPLKSEQGVKGALIHLSETKEVEKLAKKLSGNYAKYQFSDIVGSNSSLSRQIELARIASKINSRVLITGESGTGKELFAQAMHNASRRSQESFVAISCAAIPHDLIESELFGYVAGAFSGAKREGMIGKFELANKGTLFLDEINGMPLDMQAKLLRVLQQNEIMRLGDTRTISIDVHIIAATNTDLLKEVEQDNFREDLYYRLSVVDIFIPPLRERRDDLKLLSNHILQKKALRMGLPKPRVSAQVMNAFLSYLWPGNVRELENCLERAIILAEGGSIQLEHLPRRILRAANANAAASQAAGPSAMTPGAPLPAPVTLADSQAGTKTLTPQNLTEAIARTDGNMTQAAKLLGIGRATIYRKIKEFGISN